MGAASPGSALLAPLPKTGQPVIASRKLMPSISVASGRPWEIPRAFEIVSDFIVGKLHCVEFPGLARQSQEVEFFSDTENVFSLFGIIFVT